MQAAEEQRKSVSVSHGNNSRCCTESGMQAAKELPPCAICGTVLTFTKGTCDTDVTKAATLCYLWYCSDVYRGYL